MAAKKPAPVKKKPAAKKPAQAPLAQRVKTDPALLARALADPGLRSKLPDSMLSPVQRTARKNAAFDKAFGDIEHPLAGHPLIEAAKKLTDEQYKPQLDELDVADAKAQASGTAQQGWIKDYGATIAGLGSEGMKAQQAAAAAHVAQQAAMRAHAMDAITGQAADQAARAAGRDPSLDGGAGAAMAAANQGLAARASSEATANEANAGAADAAQAAFLASMAGVQQARMGEAATQVGTRTANTLAESSAARKTLAENRGNAYTKNLVQLRGDAVQHKLAVDTLATDQQKAVMQAQSAAAGIASKEKLASLQRALSVRLQVLGADATTADAVAARSFTAQQNELDRGAAQTRAETSAAGDGRGPKAKSKYLTTAQQGDRWGKIKSAADIIKAMVGTPMDPKKPDGEKWTWQNIRAGAAVNGVGVGGTQLTAALEIAKSNRVSSVTANALHGDGLQVRGHAQVGRPAKKGKTKGSGRS